MAPRLDLHNLLKAVLGSANVYFQPPSGYLLSYPCIVYNRSDIPSSSADNAPYKLENEYTVTVIDADPDSETPMEIAKLPRCRYDRGFRSGDMNHSVFNILF